jgi:glutathione S-transferase
MKLYYHPVSTTCRPVMLFAAESGIALDFQLVDLFKGEHLQEPFCAINPSRCVPVLEDGDFRLTESSAILKYLADTVKSPAYPSDLRQRACVNERMDWFNTGFYRDFGYGAGEVIRLDFSAYPNIQRWLGKVKSLPNWSRVNEGFYTHFVQPYASTPFIGL